MLILMFICVSIYTSACGRVTETEAGSMPADERSAILNDALANNNQFEPYFSDVLNQWKQAGYQDGNETFQVAGGGLSSHSERSNYQIGSYSGKNNVLVWNNKLTNWVEYDVQVDQTGLYELSLNYHPIDGADGGMQDFRPTVMAVTIDGKFPYREARSIEFPKLFRDELPIKKDKYGDDIRPRPQRIDDWIERPFKDNGGMYSTPLLWLFEKGKHTIRLQTHESIVIDTITLKPPVKVPDYSSVRAEKEFSKPTSADIIEVEAEIMDSKNDVELQLVVDQDAFMTPKADGRQIFNSIGGTRWEKGGEAITWRFSVPEDGQYKLGMRTFQGYQSNKRTFRTIYIDGQVPFQEFSAYPFDYSSSWQGITLGSKNGEPYEIYLLKGEHTVTLEATNSPFSDVLKDTNDVLNILSSVSHDLSALLGGEDDPNRTWDVQNEFPGIPNKLKIILDDLKIMKNELLSINGREDNNSQVIDGAIRDIEDMLRYPNDIPYKKSNISSIQQKLVSVQQPLSQSPLQIDKIYVAPAQAVMPRMEASYIEKVSNGFKQFFRSFTTSRQLSANDDQVVNVWMNYGRDYVNVLQDLADQYFTPESGIKVKVDLLPQEDLIVMANAAGKAPDVAIGMTEGKPVEMAIRGAALDISKFPDFKKVAEKYAPGALVPYFFDGKYYALPESQKFNILFFRKDILQRLGLKVPNTWEEVMDILPTLQQNGYSFNIPQDYFAFIYQNGAEFYTEDGLSTALDSPEGFRAFKQYTDLFSIYGIERQVPSFYQHFRDGDMPIGVGDFNMFLQLSVGAPEINGWWGIAPMPGIKQTDGSVRRWSGGGQQASMIFEKSKNKNESWEFLKWWLSAETQERFGSDLEGFYGITFRWNTANVEAFSRLPWQPEELNVFLEQWRWYKDMANVPGSYFIPREINNAWNRTVVDGQNYRSALEEAVLNINREIKRKAVEFKFIDKEGNKLKGYDPPQINQPWEGAVKYVR